MQAPNKKKASVLGGGKPGPTQLNKMDMPRPQDIASQCTALEYEKSFSTVQPSGMEIEIFRYPRIARIDSPSGPIPPEQYTITRAT
jgi:hypothetical protein